MSQAPEVKIPLIHIDPADQAMIKTFRDGLERHVRNHSGCIGCLSYMGIKANLDAAIKAAVNRMFEKVR